MTGFRKRSKSIFNHDSNEKKTNNSNFPFLSFFFSFSAWFQVFWGGGCWSNVIFNAFTFKNPVEYVFTLTALCPHLRLYEYLKSARLLNCAASAAFRNVPWSVSIICNTQALLQLTVIICFSWKFCVFFAGPPSVWPFILRLWLKIWCEEPEISALLFWQTMLNGFLLLSRICLLFPASEEMTI